MMSYRYGRRRRTGLSGFSVNDMIQNCGGSGSGGCDPHDSSCVATSQALSDWAQNNFEANFPFGPDQMPSCPDLSDTTAITAAFMNNTPVSLGPQTGPGTSVPVPAALGTQGNVLAQYMQAGGPMPIATPPKPTPPASTPAPPAVTPQGQTVVNSSGASTPAATVPASGSNWFTSSMFDGFPNWGLVAAGGGLLFLFMMGGRR